eukprot:6214647-Pleurochrysis_carterae.AAC.1
MARAAMRVSPLAPWRTAWGWCRSHPRPDTGRMPSPIPSAPTSRPCDTRNYGSCCSEDGSLVGG